MLFLAYTAGDRWEPGIGDPTVMGWVTVAAYWMAAVLCWRAGWSVRSEAGSGGRNACFWLLLGLFAAGLGVNKQLDLQTWFTLFAKRLAMEQGWYENRRMAQVFFIGTVGVVCVGMLALLGWLVRGAPRAARLAWVGMIFLSGFILIRAASFHHVDQLLGWQVIGLKMNWVFELSGIACLSVGAAWSRFRPRSHLDGNSRTS